MAANEMNSREKLQAQLADVQTAIKAVLIGGQEYRIGSRMLQRAELKQLRDIEKDLKAQLAATDSPLMDDTFVAVFDRR